MRFADWNSDPAVVRTIEIIDGGDSVCLASVAHVGHDQAPIAHIEVTIRPEDLDRFIHDLAALRDTIRARLDDETIDH